MDLVEFEEAVLANQPEQGGDDSDDDDNPICLPDDLETRTKIEAEPRNFRQAEAKRRASFRSRMDKDAPGEELVCLKQVVVVVDMQFGTATTTGEEGSSVAL